MKEKIEYTAAEKQIHAGLKSFVDEEVFQIVKTQSPMCLGLKDAPKSKERKIVEGLTALFAINEYKYLISYTRHTNKEDRGIWAVADLDFSLIVTNLVKDGYRVHIKPIDTPKSKLG